MKICHSFVFRRSDKIGNVLLCGNTTTGDCRSLLLRYTRYPSKTQTLRIRRRGGFHSFRWVSRKADNCIKAWTIRGFEQTSHFGTLHWNLGAIFDFENYIYIYIHWPFDVVSFFLSILYFSFLSFLFITFSSIFPFTFIFLLFLPPILSLILTFTLNFFFTFLYLKFFNLQRNKLKS